MSLGWHSLPVNNFELIYNVDDVKTKYMGEADLSHTLLHNLARCYGHNQRSVIQVLDREFATSECR